MSIDRKHSRLYPKGTAYHEAGHAVMRAKLCLEPTAIEVSRNGGGLTHGTGKQHRWSGQYAVWHHAVYSLAGAYSEARACKVSATSLLVSGGALDDWQHAKEDLDWLVVQGFETDHGAAERRAVEMTRDAIKENWQWITAIAERLRVVGRLEAKEVAELLAGLPVRHTHHD
jgi:hypothetical protein